MRIDIQAPQFTITEALRSHVERRLGFALSACSDRIHQVRVRLGDINGPRRGVDKQCQLRVRLGGMPDIVVEATDADLYASIDRAASRGGRTVRRRLSRRRDRQRTGSRLDPAVADDAIPSRTSTRP